LSLIEMGWVPQRRRSPGRFPGGRRRARTDGRLRPILEQVPTFLSTGMNLHNAFGGKGCGAEAALRMAALIITT